MAESKREGGLYYLPDGTAVDSEGRAIKGAPKRQPDTDPAKQLGAVNAPSEAEQIGRAIADALSGKTAARDAAAASTPAPAPKSTEPALNAPAALPPADTGTKGESEQQLEDDSKPGLPKIADLAAHLETVTSADEVRAMQATDARKTAQPLYDARLAELESQ